MHWESVSEAYLAEPGRHYVLVSLVAKSGSSYFQPGARMIVRDDGYFEGSISAGCLEETIAVAGINCLKNNSNRILEIDTRPFFGCFGQITVLLEVLQPGDSTERFFLQVREHLQQRKSFTVCTNYSDTSANALTVLNKRVDGEKILTEQVDPLPRILIFGDWPDGRTVAKIAGVMDWDVQAYDLSGPGFSAEHVLEGLVADSMTAAIVMGHNFARDILCLKQLLKHPFGYVGMIGSRKRRQEVINELIDGEDLVLLEAIEELHCPAGLDLGGDGHQSVALSVVAEVQAKLFDRNAASLKDKNSPVHAANVPT